MLPGWKIIQQSVAVKPIDSDASSGGLSARPEKINLSKKYLSPEKPGRKTLIEVALPLEALKLYKVRRSVHHTSQFSTGRS